MTDDDIQLETEQLHNAGKALRGGDPEYGSRYEVSAP